MPAKKTKVLFFTTPNGDQSYDSWNCLNEKNGKCCGKRTKDSRHYNAEKKERSIGFLKFKIPDEEGP